MMMIMNHHVLDVENDVDEIKKRKRSYTHPKFIHLFICIECLIIIICCVQLMDEIG